MYVKSMFVINQFCGIVTGGKAFVYFTAMLFKPPFQIIGHAYI